MERRTLEEAVVLTVTKRQPHSAVYRAHVDFDRCPKKGGPGCPVVGFGLGPATMAHTGDQKR